MERYLAEQGNLCLGKYDWPIEVSAHDIGVGTRDAVQMPVLEKLGLVVSSSIPATGREGEPVRTAAVTRYALTEAGRKFYLNKSTTSAVPGGAKVEHRGDFCAAKLSLDRIIGWDELKADAGRREMVVTYTYRIAAAPDPQRRDPESVSDGRSRHQRRKDPAAKAAFPADAGYLGRGESVGMSALA